MKGLEPQKQHWIEQVVATMSIEDIPIDGQTYQYLTQIAIGKKTAEQAIREIRKEYMHG